MPKTEKFQCPVRFEMIDGYNTPIYPQNPSPEVRQYILDMATTTNGMRAAEMSLAQVWLSVAAMRIITAERLAREEATASTAPVKSGTPANPYAAFRSKLVAVPT